MTADVVALGCLLLAIFALCLWWLWREDAAPPPSARWPAVESDADLRRERVLFLCTHNSARSQMAEALLQEMAGDRLHVASAGTAPTSIHPLTVAVMATERGLLPCP